MNEQMKTLDAMGTERLIDHFAGRIVVGIGAGQFRSEVTNAVLQLLSLGYERGAASVPTRKPRKLSKAKIRERVAATKRNVGFINAIKEYRELAGVSLKEAKDFVDTL